MTASEKLTVNGMGVVVVVLPEAPAVLLMATVGCTVSTVKVFVAELTLPAEPLVCAVAYTVCAPCANAVGWARVKLPVPSAVVVPMLVPST